MVVNDDERININPKEKASESGSADAQRGSPPKFAVQISPEEKARRIEERANHVAAQPESYWQLILPDVAAELGIPISEFETTVVAKREALRQKADAEKVANRRGEKRAEKKRRAEERAKPPEPDDKPGDDGDGAEDDDDTEEVLRKHREKEKAFDALAKLPGPARETGLAELAERLGEDLATLRAEFEDFSGRGILAPKEKDIDFLLRLAGEASLFCDNAGVAYADVVVDVDGHSATWRLASTEFADWLIDRFYGETQKAVSTTTVKTVQRTLQARARCQSERHEVHLRVAQHAGKIYVDLGDPERRVVVIDADGWRLLDRAPVRFRRTPDMGVLPVPEQGGSIELLRKYVNLDGQHFVLYVSAILDAFRVRGPHIILLILGPAGATKSTKVRIACHLTDPDNVGVEVDPPGLPNTRRDLFAVAHNVRVVVGDNVSSIAPSLSDPLCLVSSGQNVDRTLFTQADVSRVSGSHPIFLTAVSNPIRKPDLADRTVVIQLPSFRETGERRRQRALLAEGFAADQPRILGAIFSAVSHGLRRLPDVELDNPPRMIDFATFATACETAYAEKGAFEAAYSGSVTELAEQVSEGEPIVIAIRTFMAKRSEEWSGTATQLMAALAQHGGAEEAPATWRSWPTDVGQFSKELRGLVELLAKFGIAVTFGRETSSDRSRGIRLRHRNSG